MAQLKIQQITVTNAKALLWIANPLVTTKATSFLMYPPVDATRLLDSITHDYGDDDDDDPNFSLNSTANRIKLLAVTVTMLQCRRRNRRCNYGNEPFTHLGKRSEFTKIINYSKFKSVCY